MATPRSRLMACLRGEVPDCVPCAPDFSNMIPARRTGRPFWDLYLHHDPPIWEAYIDCARHFDIDSLMDGYFPFQWPSDPIDPRPWEEFIVARRPDRIVTQRSYADGGRRVWDESVTVYPRSNPPVRGKSASALGLPPEPPRFEPVEGVKPVDRGLQGLRRVKRLMGEQGLVGVNLINTGFIRDEREVMEFHDHPASFRPRLDDRLETVHRRIGDLKAMDRADRPDFICVGGSGTLIFQTPTIYREWTLPAIREAIEQCEALGLPTHFHSCGPEAELVRIMAEETSLTVIDPLETPPMGDCELAELKRRYGGKIVLKGNLHTTDVMLRGSVSDVTAAARRAIDAAAAGGRFILSTGDQCGRDTPDANLRAMVDTARTNGRY